MPALSLYQSIVLRKGIISSQYYQFDNISVYVKCTAPKSETPASAFAETPSTIPLACVPALDDRFHPLESFSKLTHHMQN